MISLIDHHAIISNGKPHIRKLLENRNPAVNHWGRLRRRAETKHTIVIVEGGDQDAMKNLIQHAKQKSYYNV